MATGINASERLSPEAQTAAVPHRSVVPMPPAATTINFSYEGRASIDQVLALQPAPLVRWNNDTWQAAQIEPNGIALCDNIGGLAALAASSHRARLIYLDPPYNTGLDFQSRGLQHAYKDNRTTATYVEFMRRRLIIARECLTEDGSIYIHIGHQMLSHLKVVMDEIFGERNFRNIISRRKCSSKNFTTNQYANLHDYLLFYTKSPAYVWNQPGQQPSGEWIDKEYPKFDTRGRYKLVPIHAPGTRNGETGQPWRDMNPPPGKHWQYAPSKLEQLDKDGFIHWSKTGNPRRKVYFTDDKSLPYTDNWDGFRDAHHQSIEVTGYPTEKNLDMLKMIVGASSNPGDLVVDPFCGSGTTLDAADQLGRRWLGIDKSFVALAAATKRLRHGSERMGDYVIRKKDTSQVSLFAEEPAPHQKVRERGTFSLFADAELSEEGLLEAQGIANG